jgi:hypothetical protein
MIKNISKIKLAILGLFVLSIGAVTALTTDNLLSDHPFLKGLFDKLTKHQDHYRPEKIYVQLDKTQYKPGESIWLSAYIRDAQTLKPSSKSDVVYVEFINPRGAVEKTITILAQNGQAAGEFQIPDNAKGGNYKIKAYTKWLENTSEFYEKEIQIQAVVLPNLNMKLDFERESYGPGASASAELNLESLDKKSLANHNFNYVFSIAGKEILRQSGKTDNKGIAKITLNLPKELSSNDALLNVLFEYKGQTESISRTVPITLGNIDLQFFPEGGEMIAGQNNAIAFKAIDELGKAVDLSGYITDEGGNKITDFESYHQGMGKFEFKPEQGKNYIVKITQPSNAKGTFQLPTAKNDAITLKIRGQNKQEIELDVLTNKKEELYVVAQSGGKIIFSKDFKAEAGLNPIKIPTSTFPIGIASITVFDSNKNPKSERKVFVNQHKQLKVKVKPGKEKYLPREKVDIDIEISDEYGRPVAGQFSVAVADDKLLTFADDKQAHILAYTLLESDLKGQIDEPNFYFDDENDPKRFKPEVDRKRALDNLLMTQGWSRIVWKEVIDEKLNPLNKKGEKAVFAGKVVDFQNKPIEGADISIAGISYAKSDKDGTFLIEGYKLYQPVSISVSKAERFPLANSITEYSQSLTFSLLGKRTITGVVKDKDTKEPIAFASVQSHGSQTVYVSTNEKGEYKIEIPETNTQLYVYHGGGSIQVDLNQNKNNKINIELENTAVYLESVVTTIGSTGIRKNIQNKPSSTKDKVKTEAIGKSANKNIPMVNEGNLPEKQNSVQFDNIAVPSAPVEAEKMIDMNDDVKNLEQKIDFKRDQEDLVEEKKIVVQKEEDLRKKRPNVVIAATGVRYVKVREFYAPKYESKQQPKVRDDFRSTIYWNPSLTIGKDGKARISFYNSDDITQFRVTVEGFGNEGNVGRTEYKYFIQLPVALTAKIPVELLTEDNVSFPVTLSNNTDENISGQLLFSLPSNIKLVKTSTISVQLAANEAKTFLVDAVVGNEPAEGVLNLAFDAGNVRDEMSVKVNTRPRGFPVRIAHSGDKLNESVKFNIKDPITGSLKAKINVYPNTLNQVLGGMESMLRMPGGCFEQTSSSNYPNIMALNYMRETNSSNPELEKRAKEYLQIGYGRLTGYESKGGGFDWWGRDPAHEALTAYGLMQFIDMKTVYPVDNKLIDRTVNWLMGRKDGNGSWNKNPNCLHSWATSEITDAYIVWALTEAGFGKQIAKEIDKSYKDAVKSEDPYLIALIVNALYNVQDKRADELMRELVKTQKSDGSFMGLTASVVNSTGQALKLETGSLAALAMLKTKGYNKQLAAVIANIQAGKDFYGYGSTQGTVLALKAIIGHTKQSKRTEEDGVFALSVNGKKVISVAYKAGQKEIEIPELTQFLSTGENKVDIAFEGTKSAIPYELQLSYNTRMPNNSDKCELELATKLPSASTKMGETVRMSTQIKSKSKRDQPIVMAMIGIPAGLSVQMWQLKELQEKKVFDFFEIFDGYVVLHYEFIKAGETKEINLDLKSDIPGKYEAPASCAFLYYTQDQRVWSKPESIVVNQ